ncbi:lantibiotic dehydratase [Streptomyces sp. 8N706]|uniref:lantibiotic dehydratase n=1 Tax=Streptomyces sp. 8N706 TaxID=3457416 RepID=UPI003FD34D05
MRADDIDFDAADVALLRAAILPMPTGSAPEREVPFSTRGTTDCRGTAASSSVCPSGDEDDEEESRLRALLGRLTADPVFSAAVSLASPSLAREAHKVLSGGTVKHKRLRRLLISLIKYQLRMTYRPTPFGLFAGVSVAEFGATPALRTGSGHRAVSRPDSEWLAGLLRELQKVPGVLQRTRLVANELRIVRNGRLVLLDAHDATGAKRLLHSVRMTGPVQAALDLAAAPVAWSGLAKQLADRLPQASEGAVERCIAQLVRGGFLLSDLTPPPDCTTPLAHVRSRLDGLDHPVADALDGVQGALDALDATTPSGWGRALATVSERMRDLHDAEDVVHVDTALDAQVVLPREVQREVEHTATALWRTSSNQAGSPHLRDFHQRFLERYGTERLVPVLTLLDPARGLGVPEPYVRRPTPPSATPPGTEERDRVLGELFLGAMRRGIEDAGSVPEVVLDEAVLRALGSDRAGGEDEPRPPVSWELGAELVTRSRQSLWDGDFRLVLGANPGSPLGGATFSRFAPALGQGSARIRELVLRGQENRSDGARPAAVAYRPRAIRSSNVAAVPQWLDHRIPLGVGPAATPHLTDLRLADLAVQADLNGLHLVHTTTGERIRPLSYSMLNPLSGHVPHVARFLLELGQEGQEWCPPWNWGRWSAAPAQPRVTYRKAVLSPARWLPDLALVQGADGPERAWHGEVAKWRRRWDLPRHVLLTRADTRIAVDLDDQLHLLAFQDEVRRGAGLVVVEQYGGAQGRQWLSGPDGAHACEFVFPLFGRHSPRAAQAKKLTPDESSAATTGAPPATRRTAPWSVPSQPPLLGREAEAHVPGGEWLYAKVYAPEEVQAQLLAHHVGRLTRPELLGATGTDSWFFLRYADPDPHLRLRFHGKPNRLWSALLPELRQWMEHVRSAGLADRMVLDTYDPEIERYGGAAAIALAEDVFHADSAAVIDQLPLSRDPSPALPDVTSAALGILAVLTRLGSAHEALAWLDDPQLHHRRKMVGRDQKNAVAALRRFPSNSYLTASPGPVLRPFETARQLDTELHRLIHGGSRLAKATRKRIREILSQFGS